MKMKHILLGVFLFSALQIQAQTLEYTVDLTDRSDDTFKVSVTIKGGKLKGENRFYQFAATAPGTYQVMDIGRFVRKFEAFDKRGRKLETKKVSVNRWEIIKSKKAVKISYEIAETWDTKVEDHPVYLMCGSSLEDDHSLINGQTVFGFPLGMQSNPFKINLLIPKTWRVGTALSTDSDGKYLAESYDHVVDSPILAGRLSSAKAEVTGVPVEVFAYSKTDVVKAGELLEAMEEILASAGKFLGKLPIDRYTFLFHFEDRNMGAWEHSYSSEYVYAEAPLEKIRGSILSVAAHEFFHIVTPLNIHSEIIQKFNFETPVPSRHLWLYEGVTEWASDMMQLRGKLYDSEEYFKRLSEKVNSDKRYYDESYSLLKLALTSYTDEGQQQYGNIYQRGALVAGLLDIKLLELSGGKKGLREVMVELSRKYGKTTAFEDAKFFDDFVKMTYPEIGDFLDKYVKNAEALPYAEIYGKIGVNYAEEVSKGEKAPSLGLGLNADMANDQIFVDQLTEKFASEFYQEGDVILEINGQKITLSKYEVLKEIGQKPSGTAYKVKVKRGEETLEIDAKVGEKNVIHTHIFSNDPKAGPTQIKLREIWLKNLPMN